MHGNTAPVAEIVGAGIGGLTTASALARRGWKVRVHERAPDLRAYGAGIYIWGNGLRVLRALDAYDEAEARPHVGKWFEMRDHLNRTIERAPLNSPGAPELVTILRETLIRFLTRSCLRAGVEIVTNSTVTRASPEGEIWFEDGSSARADLVVASDGINSRARDSLGLPGHRENLHYGAVRMLIERNDADVPFDDRDKYIEYLSGNRRILYTPSSATSLYVALCCAESDLAARQVPVDAALWKQSFPHLAGLIDRFADAGRWDTFEAVRLQRWSAGKVAVIGDAAHAMPPYLGQGGGCALMNGLGVAVFADRQRDDIPQALERWEEQERPLTEHTQNTAIQMGQMNDWPDELRSAVMRITGESTYLARQRTRTALHHPLGT